MAQRMRSKALVARDRALMLYLHVGRVGHSVSIKRGYTDATHVRLDVTCRKRGCDWWDSWDVPHDELRELEAAKESV